MLQAGCLNIGNLRLSVTPHVFISPSAVLDQLIAEKRMTAYRPFMHSRGVVLLVRKGNPKNFSGLRDLLREDVRVFYPIPSMKKSATGYTRIACGDWPCMKMSCWFFSPAFRVFRVRLSCFSAFLF